MSAADLARESRESQGLPPTVTDPSALAAIATLMQQTTPPVAGEAVEVASAGSGRGANHDTV